MGCISWIINAILGFFIFLLLLGNWTGVYALRDVPNWVGGEYVEQIEQIVDDPVDKVYLSDHNQLKVITSHSDEPIFISATAVDKPNRAIQFSLWFTSVVQQGLMWIGGVWLTSFVIKIGFALLRGVF